MVGTPWASRPPAQKTGVHFARSEHSRAFNIDTSGGRGPSLRATPLPGLAGVFFALTGLPKQRTRTHVGLAWQGVRPGLASTVHASTWLAMLVCVLATSIDGCMHASYVNAWQYTSTNNTSTRNGIARHNGLSVRLWHARAGMKHSVQDNYMYEAQCTRWLHTGLSGMRR